MMKASNEEDDDNVRIPVKITQVKSIGFGDDDVESVGDDDDKEEVKIDLCLDATFL